MYVENEMKMSHIFRWWSPTINVWQTIDVNKMMIADLKYMADHRCQ